jgi:penicillin amidase
MSEERFGVLRRLLRGEISADKGAEELGISRRALMDLRRRYLRGKLPRIEGRLHAPLDGPVRVRRDRWGVTHIEAKSLADCYVALGYGMAQDRLWQLDYRRRLAQGRLAEVLGPRYLGSDRLHRTVGLSKAAEDAASEAPDEVMLVLESMASGINSWMDGGSAPPPVEFDLLDYQPEPWRPEDTIAVWKWRWWMLTGRLENITAGEAIRRFLPPHLLDLFLTIEAGEETIVPSEEPAGIGDWDTGEGSNNWVVGGSRSSSGKPILASDPHNAVMHPSQWYQAQLTAPGMDAVGAVFLGTPGIYLGHTRHTAWGVTNHTASVRDLYRETVSQGNSGQYLDGGEWRPFEVDQQEIAVRGQSPELLSIRRTVRGPVMDDFVPLIDGKPEPPLSMRWTGAEATTGFEAMLALHRSRCVDDILAALRRWPCPILNLVFADSDGRIGYHVVGDIPTRRATWHGYRPANDPAHDWGRTYSFDDLPQLIDPERDWIATANNPPWGGRGPYLSLGSWSDGYRFRRIRERVEGSGRHTPDSVGAIQSDVIHARARELAPAVARLARTARQQRLRNLGELLDGWDGAYEVDAVAPTVFSAFWEHWLRRVAGARFPERVVPLVAGRTGSVARRLLLGDDPGWFAQGTDIGSEALGALSEALDWLREKVGPRRSQWRWGRLHTVRFEHPISENETLEEIFDLGPFETSGGTGTVRAAGYSLGKPFELTGLASYRMVVDLGDPPRSWATTTGGQSGHPASPHYGDHAKIWLRDEYHPLLMDPQDISDNLEGELILDPAHPNAAHPAART